MGKEKKKEKVLDKKDIKVTIITLLIILGIFSLIFWIFFVVISYRRPIYYYEAVGDSCDRDSYELYYEKDDVRYYSPCYDEVNIVEKRFIFYHRFDVKKYIDEGRLLHILQKATITKWAYDGILQTDYYVDVYKDSDSIMVTKCQLDGKTDYYFHGANSYNNYYCKYFYQ